MNAIGIDGCRRGWFFVQLTGSGRYHIGIAEQLEALRVAITASELTLIDIPLGLRSAGAEERRCDKEARNLLAWRAASIFPAPCRQVLGCTAYADGSRINQAVTGKRLSRQTWAITPKIAEADASLRTLPEHRKLREMHPELCFRALNDGEPMEHNKKRPAGQAERLAILTRWLPHAPTIAEQAHAPENSNPCQPFPKRTTSDYAWRLSTPLADSPAAEPIGRRRALDSPALCHSLPNLKTAESRWRVDG